MVNYKKLRSIPKFQIPSGGLYASTDPRFWEAKGFDKVQAQEMAMNMFSQKGGSDNIPTSIPSITVAPTISADTSNISLNTKTGAVEGGKITETTTNLDGTQTQNSRNIQANGGNPATSTGEGSPKLSDEGKVALSAAGSAAINAVDSIAMGDKNFGAQSAAIDSAVHGVSSTLIKSGNPYAAAAGVALEGANFLTKAGGQMIQGFDVSIDNSGYGNLGHKDSSSSRDFGAFIGLGGLNQAKMDAKLQRRNEEAQMALKAANVSDTIKFEQEARMNSVDDVIQANKIALAGGTDTSLLSAKRGGKIPKAQDGAKLEDVETSGTPNVLPTGELHKNKHDLDLEHITKKGIPVVTVDDDSAETFNDVKAQEQSIQQHAEVEKEEVIFNKSLTDYIEEARKKWHESGEKDNDLLLEVGKRLTKELLYNTTDKAGLIEKQEEKL